jgi:hypothetical protein
MSASGRFGNLITPVSFVRKADQHDHTQMIERLQNVIFFGLIKRFPFKKNRPLPDYWCLLVFPV